MKGKKTMLLEFTQEEYDSIPSPKRTWVMGVLERALADNMELLKHDVAEVWVFEMRDGSMKTSKGRTMTEAFLGLGLSSGAFRDVKRHARERDARAQRWYPKGDGPLEV